MSFVAEFLARWVSSTIHGFAMHAPAALAGEHLADALIDAVARYLLSEAPQEAESTRAGTPTGVKD